MTVGTRDVAGGHKLHWCDTPGCDLCSQGLAFCMVCWGYLRTDLADPQEDDCLLATCPGHKLNEDVRQAIRTGKVVDLALFRSQLQEELERRALVQDMVFQSWIDPWVGVEDLWVPK